jgi:hypothetical protein
MAYSLPYHDTVEAAVTSREAQEPAPKYRTLDRPEPLSPQAFPEEVEQILDAIEATGVPLGDNVHVHLHYGDGGHPLEKLVSVIDSLLGPEDNRRRQHSRDSRSVPLPSEISSVYFPNRRPTQADLDDCCMPGTPSLSSGPRPSRVVLDGAQALRERAIAEQVALADLNNANADFWDAHYREDRVRKR